MKFIAIIPARYASTRFPAKPLALLNGTPIVRHVYERVSSVIPETYVATDNFKIRDAVLDFGGKVVMTSPNHKSGTDRCNEALHLIDKECDIVINVQGDEPFVEATQLKALQACFEDADTQIATLVKPFTPDMGIAALKNPNTPKVVIDDRQFALYFSRSVIPFLRDLDEQEWLNHHRYYKHIGLYAYRAEVLRTIACLPSGILEKSESLEQLRWLEAGFKIRVGFTDVETIGIDTPDDLIKAEAFIGSLS